MQLPTIFFVYVFQELSTMRLGKPCALFSDMYVVLLIIQLNGLHHYVKQDDRKWKLVVVR
jgi:hypothetical protein